ncbi:tyrosine-type recombinase/integrase [Streptomyces sp. NPDC059193]|uniref:tyrosine-type recombinase/integrase n=1 Tax=Streptomyces sp. NPDC059193 TaxID=3346763 RepID=UPI003673B7DF
MFFAPDMSVDTDLVDFARSSSFRHLARETKRNYATDIRLLLDFLWSRGKRWAEADAGDLRDYRHWRTKASANPGRVSGTKWNRELAAFTRLYAWAKGEGLVRAVPADVKRPEDRAPDSRSSRVSWLTPRTWRLWTNVGLRGWTSKGMVEPGWTSRTDERDAAFVRTMLSSGMRRQEAGSLLMFEVPRTPLSGGRYCHGMLAGATTRTKASRTVYLSTDAVEDIDAYIEGPRAWAVHRAHQEGRYERLPMRRMITKVSAGLRQEVQWVDLDGVVGRAQLRDLTWDERRYLFMEGPEGPEPAWLWLNEQGMPFQLSSWETVFRRANQRCERVLRPPVSQMRDVHQRFAPYATPHSCRHSFALYMLVVLNHVLDRRYGLTPQERRDFQQLYGDPWFLVQNLLGHRNREVTMQVYLAPVTHLGLTSMLEAAKDPLTSAPLPDHGLDATFARLARESSGIQDIDAALAGAL